GGMIITDNEALARELRAMRHWGDRTIEFGVRDATQLAWNGRMSEILAGLAREQLKGYRQHLADIRDAVAEFQSVLAELPGLSLALGHAKSPSDCAFTQVVLRFDERHAGIGKDALMAELTKNGIANFHANFEPINSLSLFRNGTWREWILRGDIERVARNNNGPFPVAEQLFARAGFGLGKTNFLSAGNLSHLKSVLRSLIKRAGV